MDIKTVFEFAYTALLAVFIDRGNEDGIETMRKIRVLADAGEDYSEEMALVRDQVESGNLESFADIRAKVEQRVDAFLSRSG